MPAFTWLSDWQVREWQSVPDDKDYDELFQEFRKATGENWLTRVHEHIARRSFWQWLRRQEPRRVRSYTLYADCHGEWQVINLVGPSGGSVFHYSEHTREMAMNYMMGTINGLRQTSKAVA